MIRSKAKFLALLMTFSCGLILLNACKAKKPVAPSQEVVINTPVEKEPIPVKKEELDSDGDGIPDSKDNCPDEIGTAMNYGCPQLVTKPINYKNIQFEFNSSVLKTSSYAVLEEIVQQMKKNPENTFQLNGNSSAEGTDKRNMMLSIDRANAVKAYLVNNGIRSRSLSTQGFGETMPIVSNNTEDGRAMNRRVEIKLVK